MIAFVLSCSFYKAQTDSSASKVTSPNSETLSKETTEVLKPSENTTVSGIFFSSYNLLIQLLSY